MDTIVAAIVGLVGVVVGAFLTIRAQNTMFERQREYERSYAGPMLICRLETFIADCNAVALDLGEENNQGMRNTVATWPKLSFNDLDIDFKSIPADLLYRVLSLPNKLANAAQVVADVWDYDFDPPDFPSYFAARRKLGAQLSMEARVLCIELKKLCQLPHRPTKADLELANTIAGIQLELQAEYPD